MSTFNTPLDINQSPQKILMDALNYENRTSFSHDDFIFGTPEPFELIPGEPLTRILLTPKVGSPYYNSRHFYYNRMDLGSIYASRFIELNVGSHALLSELIPTINEFYGIALTSDDYVEQSLPVFDPQNPQPLVVALQAKASSLLFEGVAMLKLNEVAPVESSDNYDRKVFFIMDNGDKTVWKNTLKCIGGDNKVTDTFQAFRNASAIESIDLFDVQVLANKNLLVKGQFKFTANLSGASQAYNVSKAILSSSGDVIAAGDVFGPFTVEEVVWSSFNTDCFIVDKVGTVDPASTNHVHKYSAAGERDTVWSIAGLNYTPDMIRVDTKGRIYTVSPSYSDSGRKIRIDRYNSDGQVDATFTPIFISMTDGSEPYVINNISFDNLDDFFIGLNASSSPSSIGATIAINGVGVIDGNQTQVYGYLPVFKFKENGSLDSTFKWEQKDFMPDVVINTSAGALNNAKSTAAATAQGVSFLTYAENWVTGVLTARPVSYDVNGQPIFLSGKDHFDMPYWSVNTDSLLICKNGRTYMYGEASFRNPAGGERVVSNVVVSYRADGSFDRIVYTAPTVAGPALKITKAALFEFAY